MHRILVLVVLVTGVLAPVAARADGVPEVGPRIGLFAAPATFPAGAPFHVEQGFTCDAGRAACLSGLTHFDLYVDGQPVPAATDPTFGDNGTLLEKLDLTNFGDGLPAGTHTFSGEWYYLGRLVQTQAVTIDFV